MTSPPRETQPVPATSATYRIRVAGALGEEWSRRAQGMTLSVRRSEPGGSFTELVGELPDETALMGVLDALYSHGAHLLSVVQIGEDETTVVTPEESQRP